jgi:hypothetical protein
LYCIALHCIAQYFYTSHYFTPLYISSHLQWYRKPAPRDLALHYSTLHYSELLCVALRCVALLNTSTFHITSHRFTPLSLLTSNGIVNPHHVIQLQRAAPQQRRRDGPGSEGLSEGQGDALAAPHELA